MIVTNKTLIKPLKINNNEVIIKYDNLTANKFELSFKNNINTFHSKLYVYYNEGEYMFGEYSEYRNFFINLDYLNIKQQIFIFLLKNNTNIDQLLNY